ncbi:glycosyltransferase [Paenibacillus sp. strain BS8-2]
MKPARKRVLIGSPVHQKPFILCEFLNSLLRLKNDEVILDYYFVDDNTNQESSNMLQQFKQYTDNVYVQKSSFQDRYVRDDNTHHWNGSLVDKVTFFKDSIIAYATEHHYDFLFLIDSDLLIHPHTIEHLVRLDKDIVSEIFWTRWKPDKMPLPQVWIKDDYTQFDYTRSEQLTEEMKLQRFKQFILQMLVPGLYPVGGLGACTLISRKALHGGVSFKEIKNLSFVGEDRHFCVRALALGFDLYVDTHYPAGHLYRNSDMDRLPGFKQDYWGIPEIDGPIHYRKKKLTLSMIIKNESQRFLKEVLEEHRNYIDEAVIIDDGSTDHSAQICLDTLKGIPVHLVRNDSSKFNNEVNLRKQQWEETIKTKPDWILNLDADEVFEKGFAARIKNMINYTDVDAYAFRLYDFWSPDHYRDDTYWRAHHSYRTFLIRYKEDMVVKWKETPQHCGRFPANTTELSHAKSELRLKHFGWSREEDRRAKYDRYKELDPQSLYGVKKQYESILDASPVLVPWQE